MKNKEPDSDAPLQTFRVSWDVEIEATDKEAAARLALEMQRDRESIATVFRVTCFRGISEVIDLQPEEVTQ